MENDARPVNIFVCILFNIRIHIQYYRIVNNASKSYIRTKVEAIYIIRKTNNLKKVDFI